MPKSRRFHELLRDAREKARQSTEVMGILLNMEEPDYVAIERGEVYPDPETLRRLCMMLEWNLHDTQRLLNNERAALPGAAAGGDEAALRALQSVPLEPARRSSARDSLAARMRDVRETTGQQVEIIAMLLGIPVEHYRRLEAGEAPSDELLRRISMVYDWNYLDLIALLRSEQARALQPHRMGSPFPAASTQGTRLKGLTQELEVLFAALPEKHQLFVLAQLELVRETMRKLRQAS